MLLKPLDRLREVPDEERPLDRHVSALADELIVIGQKADGFPRHFAEEDLLELCLQLLQHFLPHFLLEVLLFVGEPLLLDNDRLVRFKHELFPFRGCSDPDHVDILLLFLS